MWQACLVRWFFKEKSPPPQFSQGRGINNFSFIHPQRGGEGAEVISPRMERNFARPAEKNPVSAPARISFVIKCRKESIREKLGSIKILPTPEYVCIDRGVSRHIWNLVKCDCHGSPQRPPGSTSLQNDGTNSKSSIDLWIVIFCD